MIAIMIGGMVGLTILSVSSYRHYKTSMKIQEQLNRNAEILDRANELFRAYLETGDQSYLEYVDEELERSYSNAVKAKAIEMFVSGQFNTSQIARCLGTYRPTVSRWIDKYFGKNENNFAGLKSKV